MTIPPLANPPAGVDGVDWTQACAAVRGYCRWHIAPSVTEDVVLDGSGGPVLFLRTLRLTDLKSVTNDGQPVDNPEWSQAGMVRGPWRWSSKWRSIELTMTHGYEVCPDEIVGVIASLIGRAKRRGVKSRQVGGVSISYSDLIDESPTSEVAILDRYRLQVYP